MRDFLSISQEDVNPVGFFDAYKVMPANPTDLQVEPVFYLALPIIRKAANDLFVDLKQQEVDIILSEVGLKVWDMIRNRWLSCETSYATYRHIYTIIRNYMINKFKKIRPDRLLVKEGDTIYKEERLTEVGAIDLQDFLEKLPDLVVERIVYKSRYPQVSTESARHIVLLIMKGETIYSRPLYKWFRNRDIPFFIAYVTILFREAIYYYREHYRGLNLITQIDYSKDLSDFVWKNIL